MRASWIALALLFAACGDDDEGSAVTAPPGAGGAPRPATAPAKPGDKPMPGVTRIEDKVACPTPTDAKKCDPNAPMCDANEYCLEAGTAHYCGPCPERDAIRHVFKPRDFLGAEIRDPFYSYVIQQPGLGSTASDEVLDKTQRCTRRDQLVATNYSYQSLKLVGIVSQGTQRKVLMMDASGFGNIIKKGDCVGKEQAWVKDIGAGYVTFTIDKRDPNNPDREPEEQAVQLYPTQVSVNTQVEDPGARTPIAPIVTPPTSSQGAQGGQPAGGPSIRARPARRHDRTSRASFRRRRAFVFSALSTIDGDREGKFVELRWAGENFFARGACTT